MKNKHLLLCLLCICFLFSCNKTKNKWLPEESEFLGVAAPIKLNHDLTTIFLQDFIIDVEKIDSVTFGGQVSYTTHSNDKYVLDLIYDNSLLSYYTPMYLWVDGYAYTILLEKSDKIKVSFNLPVEKNKYSGVNLAGDFNDWNPANTELSYQNGAWQTEFYLNPGTYQYQVVADGNWMLDPNNAIVVSNNMGGFNSLLEAHVNSTESLAVLFPHSFVKNNIKVGFKNNITNYYVLWNNFLLNNSDICEDSKTISFSIPKEAQKETISYIRIFSENNAGKSNDLKLPLKNDRLILDASELTRTHKEAQIYYFLMIDRFFNGNHFNDDPIIDEEVAPIANFMGGDLAGITRKLEDGYFDELNINTLWLSPVVQNPLIAYNEYPAPHRKFSGYHGYWPINSTKIDHRFGTDTCLKNLTAAAHKRGINVILDFVSNHVHQDNPLIIDNPQWATKLELENGKQNIRLWDTHRLTTWFDTFLPSLDFEQQAVVDTMVALGLYWLNTYNLDGFRHDATKHIPTHFWRAMTLALKKNIMRPNNKTILQIGETFGSRELIGSYVGHGLIDGQFDFNLYFDARSVFALDNESFARVAHSLDASFRSYGSNSLMGNISGNHDLPRFATLASGDLKMEENAKEVAWSRQIEVTDTAAYLKTAQMLAFMINIPGVPVIYYGDEIGMAGADDPDNRRMMRFDNLSPHEEWLKKTSQKLVSLRRENMALNYGHFEWLKVNNNTLIFARKYFENTVIVVMNKDNKNRSITFDVPTYLQKNNWLSNFGSIFDIQSKTIEIHMVPYGIEVLSRSAQ